MLVLRCSFLVIFFLLVIDMVKAVDDCTPKLEINSTAGNFTPKLGNNFNQGIAIILKSIADSGLPGYCKMQVEISFQNGLRFYPSEAKASKDGYYYSLGHYTPLYTVEIKDQFGQVLHQLNFGNKERYKRFPKIKFPKTVAALENLWGAKKDSILQALELEYSNELKEFDDFLERFRGERLVYTNNGYVPTLEKRLYPNQNKTIEYDKKINASLNGKAGFIVNQPTAIPIQLSQGDQITIIAKGEIIKGYDRFSPNGLGSRLQRNYPKIFNEARYGRLLARIGYQSFDIGSGGQFTVKQLGALTLVLNAKDDNRKTVGYFEAWVFVNGRLVNPVESDNPISVLENSNNLFVPIDCSPDLSLILGINTKNELAIWRASDGELLQTYAGHKEGIYDQGFLSEEPLLVTIGKDERLNYWDVVSGKLLKSVALTDYQLRNACFDPKMKHVAFIVGQRIDPFNSNKYTYDSEIYKIGLYDQLRAEELLQPLVLEGHGETITSLGFLTYDDLLLSGDKKGTINLWDTEEWKIKMAATFSGESIDEFISDPLTHSIIVRTVTPDTVPPYVGGVTIVDQVKENWFDIQSGKPGKSNQLRAGNNPFPSMIPKAGDKVVYLSEKLDYTAVLTRRGQIQLWNTQAYFKQ